MYRFFNITRLGGMSIKWSLLTCCNMVAPARAGARRSAGARTTFFLSRSLSLSLSHSLSLIFFVTLFFTLFSTVWLGPAAAQFWQRDSAPPVPTGPGHLIVPYSVVESLTPEKRAALGWDAGNAVPSSDPRSLETIDVDTLGSLETGQLGLEAGYGPDVWHGARAAFTVPALQRLPKKGTSRLLRHLEIAVLQGSAVPPRGQDPDVSWFAARLRRLLDIGEIRAVRQMIEMTGAEKRDPQVARVYAESFLLAGDLAGLCAIEPKLALPRKTVPSIELSILCQLSRSERAAATLALELHDRELQADPFFRELAFMYAVDAPQQPTIMPAFLTPEQFALMQVTGVPLSSSLQALPVASYPYLAQSYDGDPKI